MAISLEMLVPYLDPPPPGILGALGHVQRSLPRVRIPQRRRRWRSGTPRQARGGAGRAPVEADGLLDHVLLLAAVTGANERGGKLAVGETRARGGPW